jgi:cytochrome c oxidase subunit 1
VIGKSYLITSFLFFPLSGGMAITIRTQLAAPDNTVVSQHTYNELFTMHGSLMMYLFAGPFAFGGLANFIVSLQVGAFDMAFPRLNALSYWWYFGGGLTIVSGFFVIGGAADFGWVAYAPLSDAVNSPGAGPDMFICVIASLDVHGRRSGQSRTFTRAPGCALLNRSRKEEPQE